MRKLLIILISLVIVSCSTFTSTEGPEWTREIPVRPGMVVFVSSGTGRDDSAARASAYRSLLDEIGNNLGFGVTSLYYRELLSNDSVDDLSLSVTNTYTAPADKGTIFFAMAEIPAEEYAAKQTEERAEAIERTAAINVNLGNAMEYYKANEDTKALNEILIALDSALSGPLTDSSITPEMLLERATEYLRNLRIEADNEDGVITITMRRAKGLFHPFVINGSIRGTYSMLNGRGDVVEASADALTGDRGKAVFPITNPYTISGSDIIFSAGIDEVLFRSIISKAPEGFLNDFISALEENSVVYHYVKETNGESTVIGVASYGEDGTLIENSEAYAAFASHLLKAGIEAPVVVNAIGDEEEDILSYLHTAYLGAERYMVLRIGVADKEAAPDSIYTRVEMRLSAFYADNTQLFVQDSEAVGKGSDDAESERNAIDEGARRAAGLLLSRI
ncbi:MAG: hypothetical protein IAA72_03400 [Spirochaetes bacterium]|uniref:LPP20 lipoprotein n=1 Tax=Candidatus Ornithospirochaeta stercoravium TaxID=2840897 RepID=A0A9D9NCY1_9SPIO|nr:hypothetical protein [Candidatus Ornithospirochaeta stercoravium]